MPLYISNMGAVTIVSLIKFIYHIKNKSKWILKTRVVSVQLFKTRSKSGFLRICFLLYYQKY